MSEWFEAAWFNDFKYFERYSDGTKSHKRQIDGSTEYFKPDPTGNFTGFIEPNKNFTRMLGNSKDAKDQYGVCNPIYKRIRDHWWQNHLQYKNPRIWYLDIETRTGRRFLKKIKDKTPVTLLNKETNETLEIPFNKVQGLKNPENYKFKDNGVFTELVNMPFMAKTTGFPEPSKAQHEITLIQIYDNIQETIYVLGLRDFDLTELNSLGYHFDATVKYVNCKDEVILLTTFIKLFNKLDPLLILAWNGNGFDYPYLYNRINKLGLPLSMSNYGNVEISDTLGEKGRVKYTLNANGHFYMDFMEIYKKFTFAPQASYSLDAIAKFELKDNKVPHTEFRTFDSFYTGEDYAYQETPYEDTLRELIRKNYKENKDLFQHYVQMQFVYYGIYDVILLKKINDKLKLTNLMLEIADKMGVMLSDTLRTVKPWSQNIANHAYFRGQIMPPRVEHESPNIIGGFVREPKPGKYNYVLNLDINSMYPNLSITAFNMSPETYVPLENAPGELRDLILSIVDGQDETRFLELEPKRQELLSSLLKKYKLSMAINGALFRAETVGLIPELVTQIYDERKKFKKIMLSYQSKAVEIKDILHKRKS